MTTWLPKVGDKGKTRGGADYEIMAVLPDTIRDSDRVVVALNDRVSVYYPNGAWSRGNDFNERDLMPPVRTVYLNMYPSGEGYAYSTPGAAKASLGRDAILVAHPVEIPG